ncbi:sensor histidine kinase [Sporosarcina gallistercoris]|uniref:histidine kinase n=1 Tax=Sporosarcina gallistercoris TaxID=2762245 RepID=A0ABR8PLD2_9BACL|nr:sensor histidine kinase [Sporosarcina gallistercoris]MBD7908990.1 sensor histidine kinase [Sporosarcina gallistercoris]
MNKYKLFVKEHIPFLLFQVVLLLFIVLLFWLDGARDWGTALYAMMMGIMLTIGYLFAKFITRRSFYEVYEREPGRMEDALIGRPQTPEHRMTAQYMRKLYKLYHSDVQKLDAAQHRQLHFINQWVHQMKTPISVLGLLLQEEEIDRKSFHEELDRLQDGLDAVLVNARLETFEDDMRIERVALEDLVRQVVTEHKRLFITNGVFPEIHVDPGFVVATDPKWLKIILGQFITNAVKYTFEKGKKVYVNASKTAEGIQLIVQDEGIGIPETDLKRVTRAFFTGENGRKTGESTGMGLYIASEVSGRLGHMLTIESKVDEGTAVSMLFLNGEAVENDGTKNRRIDGSDENL